MIYLRCVREVLCRYVETAQNIKFSHTQTESTKKVIILGIENEIKYQKFKSTKYFSTKFDCF